MHMVKDKANVITPYSIIFLNRTDNAVKNRYNALCTKRSHQSLQPSHTNAKRHMASWTNGQCEHGLKLSQRLVQDDEEEEHHQQQRFLLIVNYYDYVDCKRQIKAGLFITSSVCCYGVSTTPYESSFLEWVP